MNARNGRTALTSSTLVEAADAIARGEVTSLELTRAALDAIAAGDRAINAFVAVEVEAALSRAAALDRAPRTGRGPLHGVPLAHKDMFYRAGEISACGSTILADFRPSVTATAVERLDAAGALSLGRLNMAEFAMNGTGHNPHHGDCHNPWRPDHCAGGSSSGSAAAVAARFVHGALGSDTAGSIRIPSAFCGVTGIKPTQTRVSRFGIMPLSFSNDTVGPIARTARDCARLLRVIAGHDPRDVTSSTEPVPDYESALDGDLRGIRIGVPDNCFLDGADPDVLDGFQAAAGVFEARGAAIVRVKVPHMPAILTYSGVLLGVESATVHARWMRERSGDYSTHVAARLFRNYAIPATIYLEALSRRGPILRDVAKDVFGQADVVLAPTLPIVTPSLSDSDIDTGRPDVIALTNRIPANTRPISYLGLPAASIPCGFDGRGMPLGLQIWGRSFGEGTVLRVADAFQRDTDYHRREPGRLAQ